VVTKIQAQLKKEDIPLQVFEAFRSPQRQGMLERKRPKVTWVGPWGSIHQYGLAVDFVIRKPNGGWSWDDSGGKAKYWTRMHEIALENGMTPLYKKDGRLREKPHIQLVGVSSSQLKEGIYPEGGDPVWAEHLGALIDDWSGPNRAPPKPDLAPERPPLDPADIAELETEVGTMPADRTANALHLAAASERFQRMNKFVALAEGGFVDDPRDKGGATNMGITIRTLAEWRGTEVSVDDVRELSREEADAIYWSNYYSICRCSELPERMAAVVYNCAVLSGPKRAIEIAQKAFNRLGLVADGEPLDVDGILGPMTIGAMRDTDATVLAEAFMDEQEAYLRTLDNFGTFGAGWMNRMGALREFVNTLPQGAGIRPTKQMKISDSKLDLEDVLKLAVSVKTGRTKDALSGVAGALLQIDKDDSASSQRNKAILSLLLGDKLGDAETMIAGEHINPITVKNDASGKPPLTPVNAALGETVGRALNGKKSVTGLLGLLLTTFMANPNIGLSGDIVNFLASNSQTLVTLFSLMTGWGFLGKMDKAIRLVGIAR
jgi:peptidoglycan L-alanyl-D-glutamate endopeptidase CwlK